jgi:hypothetical protein
VVRGHILDFRRGSQPEIVLAVLRLKKRLSALEETLRRIQDLPRKPALPYITPQIFVHFRHPLFPQRGVRVVGHELGDEWVEIVPFVCTLSMRNSIGVAQRALTQSPRAHGDIALHTLRIGGSSVSELRHDEQAGSNSRTGFSGRDEVDSFGRESEHHDGVEFASICRDLDPVWGN